MNWNISALILKKSLFFCKEICTKKEENSSIWLLFLQNKKKKFKYAILLLNVRSIVFSNILNRFANEVDATLTSHG